MNQPAQPGALAHPSAPDQPAAAAKPGSLALPTLLCRLCDDALAAFALGVPVQREGFGARRASHYDGSEAEPLGDLRGAFGDYFVAMTRAAAPLGALHSLPMGELFADKLTLEIGARGLRSWFSSKPSEKDEKRVRRTGTLAARVLAAVQLADGPRSSDEHLVYTAFVTALGLSREDTHALLQEQSPEPREFELYGDVEPALLRKMLRGAWLAALEGGLDQREDLALRTLAGKLGIGGDEVEANRNTVVSQLEKRRIFGLASCDAVRFVLGAEGAAPLAVLPALTWLTLPQTAREEALGAARSAALPVLSKRYRGLSDSHKAAVLAIAWSAACSDDPSLLTQAQRRARHQALAADLGYDGAQVRRALQQYLEEMLDQFAALG